MMKIGFVTAVVVMAASGAALAGGQAGTVGVGAEYQISGAGGASLNYDAGTFHIGGFIGFHDPAGANNTTFMTGARFYYHVHSTAMADFGVGVGLGFVSVPPPPGDTDRPLGVYIEPGVQTRLFLAPNVALSFTAGLVIGVVDAAGVAVTGQGIGGSTVELGPSFGFTGGAGVHYYFF